MSQSTRHRRPTPASSNTSSPSQYSKLDKRRTSSSSSGDGDDGIGLGWAVPLMALGLLRYMSATTNIIHDCDEVFNYWEPLHYLIFKSGFQTWEYRRGTWRSLAALCCEYSTRHCFLTRLKTKQLSAQFALRSYLYVLLHGLVGWPVSWWFGVEKVQVFYAVRFFLGVLSVIADAALVVALSRKYGKRLASYALALLCLTSGCFFASTSFLPSSFAMYAMSLSSAFYLLEKPHMAVATAATGVILGWPFSILAFLPVTLLSLRRSFKKTFLSGAIASVFLLALSVLTDYYYYKKWTSSLLNLLFYNVLGGGDSHLYGTEGPMYYLRNGFNNFNICFVLALVFPIMLLLQIARKKYVPDLVVVLLPIYIWLGFMTLQPHKEERFLYPIYPLLCVAAAAFIDSVPDIFRDVYGSHDDSILVKLSRYIRPVILGVILCVSHARTFSLIHGYSAPLEIYKYLDYHEDSGMGSTLCVGGEWHRFPSSFFIPDYVAHVRWIDDGFRGLLPFPFNSTLGGTSAAPTYFNNKNIASPEQYFQDLEQCTLLVELHLQRPHLYRGSHLSTWEVVAALPYLDRELSPTIHRSFFVPYQWMQKNVFGLYKLLRRIPSE